MFFNEKILGRLFSLLFFSVFIQWSTLLSDQTSSLRFLSLNILLAISLCLLIIKDIDCIKINATQFILFLFLIVQGSSFLYSLNATLILYNIQITFFLLIGILFLPTVVKKYNLQDLNILKVASVICLVWHIFGIYDFIYLSEDFLLPHKNSYLVSSVFGNKNVYASATMLFTPIVILGFIRLSGKWKIINFAIFNLNIVMIILLQTLSVWICLIVSLVLIIVGAFFFRNRIKAGLISNGIYSEKWIYSFFFLLLFVVGYLFYMTQKRELGNKINASVKVDSKSINSVNERYFLWEKSYNIIKEHPLFGVGSGNWKVFINNNDLSESSAQNGNVNYGSPHNDLILIISENGIIGAFIFLTFALYIIFGGIFNLYKTREFIPENLLLIVGIISFFIYGLFEYPFSRPEHVFLLIIYISLLYNFSEFKIMYSFKKQNFKIVLLLLFMLILFNLNWVKSDYYALKINEARFEKNWNKVIRYCKKINTKIYNIDAAIVPIDWYEGIGNFSAQNYSNANKSFLEAYNKFPYNLHVINNLASSYSLLNKNDSAIFLYKKALLISRNFDDARINYCIVLYNLGEKKKCYEEVSKLKNDSIISLNFNFIRDVLDPDNKLKISSIEELKQHFKPLK